jgi:hypothetical protein
VKICPSSPAKEHYMLGGRPIEKKTCHILLLKGQVTYKLLNHYYGSKSHSFPIHNSFFSLANWCKILQLLWGGATITTRVLNSNLLNIVLRWGLGCQVAFSHNRSFVKFLLFRPKLFYGFDSFFKSFCCWTLEINFLWNHCHSS